MQKINGVTVHQACAACKHQRKKCSENCLLAPFFPSEKSRQFQAVHKVFGVSNVSKILKSIRNLDERSQAIETLVWEAQWRQVDPVLGCFGQYKKIFEELKLLKSQQISMPTVPEAMMYKSASTGWNNDNGVGGRIGLNYTNNTINYIDNNGNLTLEPTSYNYASHVQIQEKGTQGEEALAVCCSPNSVNCLSQHYYLPDQYSLRVKMDKTKWEGAS